MTGSVENLVGRPWEIQRTASLVPDNPHTVDIFGKSGGAPGYIAQISLVDEYGVGFVILTAGPLESATASILIDALIDSLIPAIDEETRMQAQRYTGNFSVPTSSDSDNHTDTPVELALALNGTGLKIESIKRNGSDGLS